MATSFGHNGHHPAISQKRKIKNLRKLVHAVQTLQFIWDPTDDFALYVPTF